jgi:hypothetical protein
MNEDVLLYNDLFLRSRRLTKILKVTRNTQAEVSTMKTAAIAGTAGGDAQVEAYAAEMTAADVAAIRHEAKIP